MESTAANPIRPITWLQWLNPYHHHNLEQRVDKIAKNARDSLSTERMGDLKRSFKLASSWSLAARNMQAHLRALPPETLKAFMFQLMQASTEREINYYFACCLGLMGDQNKLDISGFKTQEIAHLSFETWKLTKSAALKSGLEKERQAIGREFLVEARYFFYNFVEILISLTGINEVIRGNREEEEGRTNSYEAKAKIETYWQLVALPSLIFGVIYYRIERPILAKFLTGLVIIVLLTAIATYNRYWRPCPIAHPGLTNLSIKLLQKHDFIYPRRDILKKIETAFKARKSVLLVGDPGSGKSQIMRSFAEQILTRNFCTFLKNPQVFTCNASTLKIGADTRTSLSNIADRFKDHSDQLVLCLDEFHALFGTDKELFGNGTGQLLKTFWDNYRYIIAATTTEEYEKHVKNQPAIGGRRFEYIQISSMGKNEIRTSLSQHLAYKNANITFEQSVIDYMIDKALVFNPQTSLVDAAHSLLDRAIEEMESTAQKELENEILALRTEIEEIEQQLMNYKHDPSNTGINTLIKQLTNQRSALATAEQSSKDRKRKTTQLQNMEAYHSKLERQGYHLTAPDIDLAKNPVLQSRWIALHAQMNIVREWIKREREELALPLCLDKALIDKILGEQPDPASITTTDV